ncbi:MAG: helix-turn-helix transcriptional regulator, partial [Vicinamibacterales bacterium]
VMADNLSAALSAMTDPRAHRGTSLVLSDGLALQRSQHDVGILKELIASLDRLQKKLAVGVKHGAVSRGSARQTLVDDSVVSVLLRFLGGGELSTLSFLLCAQAFREAVRAPRSSTPAAVAASARAVVEQGVGRLHRPWHPAVGALVVRFEGSAPRTGCASEQAHADALHIDRAHLGRLLHRDTGFGFRDWRRGVRLRAAVVRCSRTDEPFATIAKRLGYAHPTQFDREFRKIFGTTPTALRRLDRALCP